MLQDIYNKDGILRPTAVVNEARDDGSPLHPLFEWDDSVAAEAYRLDQAMMLIRSIKVSYQTITERIDCHAYVRDPEQEKKVQGYKHISHIKQDEEIKLQTIEAELLRAAAILGRVRDIRLTLGMDLALEKMIDELGRLSVEVIEQKKAA